MIVTHTHKEGLRIFFLILNEREYSGFKISSFHGVMYSANGTYIRGYEKFNGKEVYTNNKNTWWYIFYSVLFDRWILSNIDPIGSGQSESEYFKNENLVYIFDKEKSSIQPEHFSTLHGGGGDFYFPKNTNVFNLESDILVSGFRENKESVNGKYEKIDSQSGIYYKQKPIGDWIIYKEGWQWVISNADKTRNKSWIRNNSSNITATFDSSLNESNNNFDFQVGVAVHAPTHESVYESNVVAVENLYKSEEDINIESKTNFVATGRFICFNSKQKTI